MNARALDERNQPCRAPAQRRRLAVLAPTTTIICRRHAAAPVATRNRCYGNE